MSPVPFPRPRYIEPGANDVRLQCPACGAWLIHRINLHVRLSVDATDDPPGRVSIAARQKAMPHRCGQSQLGAVDTPPELPYDPADQHGPGRPPRAGELDDDGTDYVELDETA